MAGYDRKWVERDSRLSDREMEVARAVTAGSSNKEIAAALSMSVRTVEHHLTSAYRKLGVRSRTGLAARLGDNTSGPGPTAPPGPFQAGRQREAAMCHDAIVGVRAGRGSVILVEGDPGIGKSTLLSGALEDAAKLGVRVAAAQCPEEGGLPFSTWAAVMDQLDVEFPTSSRVGDEFVGPSLDAVRNDHAGTIAAALIEGSRRLEGAAVAMDDFHWTDASGMLVLRHLAEVIESSPLCVVVAYRPTDWEEPELDRRLRALSRRRSVRHLALSGLDETAAAELIRHHTGKEPEKVVTDALVRRTAGNPFHLVQLLTLVVGEGLSLEEATVAPAPPGIRAAVDRRVRRLTGDAQAVLAVAALIGAEFSVGLLRTAADLADHDVLTVLAEAVEQGLVVEESRPIGHHRFVHALIQEALATSMPGPRRAAIHRRIGMALMGTGAADTGAGLVRIARHLLEAASYVGDAEEAARAALAAGRALHDAGGHEDAIALFRVALDLGEQRAVDPETRVELLLGMGRAAAAIDDRVAAKAAFHGAGEGARKIGSGGLLAQAALGSGGSWIDLARGGFDDATVELIVEAIEAVGDQPVFRVRLLAALAAERLHGDNLAGAEQICAEAVSLAEGTGDADGLARALLIRSELAVCSTDVEMRMAVADELLGASRRAGSVDLMLWSKVRRAVELLVGGRGAQARLEIHEVGRLADREARASWRWLPALWEAMTALLEGRLGEAEGLIMSAYRLGRATWGSVSANHMASQLFELRRWQGRLREVEADTVAYLTHPLQQGRSFSARPLALLFAELGQTARCRAVLADLDRLLKPVAPIDNHIWGLCVMAEVASLLDDVHVAQAVRIRLEPYASFVVMSTSHGGLCSGPASRYLGLVDAVLGEWDSAGANFDHAKAMTTAEGWLPFTAALQLDQALMLLRRGRARDRRAAFALAGECIDTARALGLGGLSRRSRLAYEGGPDSRN